MGWLPAQSQVDVFFLMPGASECLIFIKWVLAVLFPLQTLSYFCIGMNDCPEDCN